MTQSASGRLSLQICTRTKVERPRTDLKEIFDRYGSLRDVYVPVDFYTK